MLWKLKSVVKKPKYRRTASKCQFKDEGKRNPKYIFFKFKFYFSEYYIKDYLISNSCHIKEREKDCVLWIQIPKRN